MLYYSKGAVSMNPDLIVKYISYLSATRGSKILRVKPTGKIWSATKVRQLGPKK